MIPLLLCSLVLVAVSLERIVFLWRCRTNTDELLENVKLAWEQGEMLQAMQAAKRGRGPVASLLATAIAHYDQGRDAIRSRLEEVGRVEIHRMERRLPTLEGIITVAPLLGLLGTVTGIIRSFRVLAAFEGAAQPAALSIGIAEALITTAAGLIIAIPAVVVYHYLQSRIESIVADMNRSVAEFLQLLSARGEY